MTWIWHTNIRVETFLLHGQYTCIYKSQQALSRHLLMSACDVYILKITVLLKRCQSFIKIRHDNGRVGER